MFGAFVEVQNSRHNVEALLKKADSIYNTADYKLFFVPKIGGSEAFILAAKAQYEIIRDGNGDNLNHIRDDHQAVYLKNKNEVVAIMTFSVSENLSPKRLFIYMGYIEKPYRGCGLFIYMLKWIENFSKLNNVATIEFATSYKNKIIQKLAKRYNCQPFIIKYKYNIPTGEVNNG